MSHLRRTSCTAPTNRHPPFSTPPQRHANSEASHCSSSVVHGCSTDGFLNLPARLASTWAASSSLHIARSPAKDLDLEPPTAFQTNPQLLLCPRLLLLLLHC